MKNGYTEPKDAGKAGASEAGKFQVNLRYKTMDKYTPSLKCAWRSILQQNGTITVRSNAGPFPGVGARALGAGAHPDHDHTRIKCNRSSLVTNWLKRVPAWAVIGCAFWHVFDVGERLQKVGSLPVAGCLHTHPHPHPHPCTHGAYTTHAPVCMHTCQCRVHTCRR